MDSAELFIRVYVWVGAATFFVPLLYAMYNVDKHPANRLILENLNKLGVLGFGITLILSILFWPVFLIAAINSTHNDGK